MIRHPLLLLLLPSTLTGSAQVPGTLDATFGVGGITIIEAGADANVLASAEDPSERIVSVVASSSFSYDRALQRHSSVGSLDVSFGSAGTFLLPDSLRPRLIAFRSDGGIVLAGNVGSAPDPAFVACVLPNGGMDLSFSGDGVATFSFFNYINFFDDTKVDQDDRIVLGGSGKDSVRTALVVRLAPNGVLDPTFGNGGIRTFNFGIETDVSSIELLPTGAILLGGHVWHTNNIDSDFYVGRLLADGSIDAAFGTAGFSELPYSTIGSKADSYCHVAVLSDGSIALAGASAIAILPGGWLSGLVTTKLDPIGVQDPGFGIGGWLELDLGPVEIAGVDLQALPDGGLLVGSVIYPGDWTAHTNLIHLDPSGLPDPDFGTSGILDMAFVGDSLQELGSMILTQSTGVLLSGQKSNDEFGPSEALLVKLNGPSVGFAEETASQAAGMYCTGLLTCFVNTVRFSGVEGQDVRLDLLDATGRQVTILHAGAVQADNAIHFDLPTNVDHGSYVLRATCAGQRFASVCIY